MRIRKAMNSNQIKLLATKKNHEEISYYIVTPTNEKIYAFTKPYSMKTWEMCKSGIRVGELMRKRSSHEGVMLLVKYSRYILPYLCEEYGLGLA